MTTRRRARLFLGGPLDGKIMEVPEDFRVVQAADTSMSLRDVETFGAEATVPVATYVVERVSIFGTWATIYMAQGLTREERDREAFRHLIRPELREVLT